jgi:hypothetical protein
MISNAFANDLLKLIFNGTAIANIANNATSSPLANLYLSLHTAGPGAGGAQGTSEVNYTGYARVPMARSGTGFTVTGNTLTPVNTVEFGEMTAGTPATAAYMCLGTAATGAGKILWRLPLNPPIALNLNVTPRIRNTTTLSLVTSEPV